MRREFSLSRESFTKSLSRLCALRNRARREKRLASLSQSWPAWYKWDVALTVPMQAAHRDPIGWSDDQISR